MSGLFVYLFPKRMKPSTLQREMLRSLREMYNLRRILEVAVKEGLYNALKVSWFTYNRVRVEKQIKGFISFLERVEAPYYDSQENLLEEKLKKRPDLAQINSLFS